MGRSGDGATALSPHRQCRHGLRDTRRAGAGRRLGIVADLPPVQRGYSSDSSCTEAEAPRPLAEEAIWLVRLLHLFPAEPEIMGLAALRPAAAGAGKARFDEAGNVVLLEDQVHSLRRD